jgi:hypothetical protein
VIRRDAECHTRDACATQWYPKNVVDPFGSAQGKTFQNVDLIGNAIRGSYFFLEYRADFSRTAARRWEFRFAEYVNLAFAVDSWDCGLIMCALRTSK